MGDGTSWLLDLDGFRVVSVTCSPIGAREVVVAGVDVEQACPGCGVLTDRVHSPWLQLIKDLPYGRPLLVRWRKRRFACR